jgi:hypothetical protein
LKFDCAEADATSPQKTSNHSIRFLNLDLLFRRAKVVPHTRKIAVFAATAVLQL